MRRRDVKINSNLFIFKDPFVLFFHKKDKIKAPSRGRKKGTAYCSYAVKTLSPHVAQETFIGSQNDKHSDLFAHAASKDTVMAVVADSHRSFLIPEQYRHAVCPTTNFLKIQMNCVIHFV